MNPKWIKINSRLQNGVNLINSISFNKFKLLITHISQCNSDELFTQNELKKLEDSLKLNEEQVQLLIQSISYIIKQSNKVVLKPTLLQKELTEILKIDPKKVDEFVKVWSNNMKDDFGDFSDRKKVTNITWEVDLETNSSAGCQRIVPKARIDLNLQNIDDTGKENVTLELGEVELLQLYNNLENIQSKLDIICSK